MANVPLEPGDYNFSVEPGATTRPYLLHVPPHNKNQTLPLVMMLHGAGGTAGGAADHYGWRERADADGFAAVFPQGLPFDLSRPPNFRQNPNVWNDFSGRLDKSKRPDDVAYLSEVLNDVALRCAVDRHRIYLTGFSNGASMTFRMGIELADRLAAIAPVSGYCWQKNIVLKRPVPMLFIVGTADPLNPIDGGMGANPWGARTLKPPYSDSVMTWRAAIAAADLPASAQMADGVTTTTYLGAGGSPLIYLTIDGQGHEWPGQRRVLPRFLSGNNLKTPDATARIWNFFKDQSLPDE
jgi:polyhydroxybutyrate depolymerase